MPRREAALTAIGSYIPAGTLDNEQLAREHPDWSAARLFAATGVRTRRIAARDEDVIDLGSAAAAALFAAAGCGPQDVDYLLVCTQSARLAVPAAACLIHARLGLPTTCGALDIGQACSGFVYGLSLAKGLIESALADRVLLITAETYSKFLHPGDVKTRSVFGDGAAAGLVTVADDATEWLGPFLFGTDGRGAGNLFVPRGAGTHLSMNGPELFQFTIRTVPPAVRALLEKSQIGLEDVDHVVFHQANGYILEHLRELIAIPRDRFCVDLAESGNTVSSTIPIALQQRIEAGLIRAGDRVMLVGFGAGYSWAAAMIRCHVPAQGARPIPADTHAIDVA